MTHTGGHVDINVNIVLSRLPVKEGFVNQIILCRDRGLNPGPSAQRFDTLPLDRWVRMMEQRLAQTEHTPGDVSPHMSSTVKETVINKLETQVEEQLEEQNQHLREQNQKCNAQLELLRNHLAHSQIGLKDRSSTGGSSRASLSLEATTTSDDSLALPPPELPTRPLSSASASLRLCSDSGGSLDTVAGERRERIRALRNSCRPSLPPTVPPRIGMDPTTLLTQDLQAAVESLALLPTSLTAGPTPTIPTGDETIHDYAEIYTPSRERTPWLHTTNNHREVSHDGSTSSTNSGSDGACCSGRPPTPPLHRFPSWESRIYQVAADGLQVAGPQQQADSANNNGRSAGAHGHSSAGYCDISVPVYATVKGVSFNYVHWQILLTAQRNNLSCSKYHIYSAPTPVNLVTLQPIQPLPECMVPDMSFESGMSDDYAIPPDALSCDSTSIESSMPSLLMRVSSYLDSPNKRVAGESLEKTGHLAKLGGKLKTWRKRWFVLKNGVLTYWKSQNDINRKPQGQIVLDEICRITRADGAATFEISTGKKTYYLTADSIATMEDWIRVLQNVQRRNATKLLLSKEDNKPTIQGWVTKVKNGHAKKCWCVLIGKMFLYFKSPSDTNPVGQINMRDARVEEVDHVSDSDGEDREADGQTTELTIGIFPTHQGPTYLLMASKQEKDSWLYHLTVVSGGGPNAGTQYEQLVQKLMETDGDPNCVLWKHPHLLHSKESIASPLTTLSSEAVQAEAVKLFKSCQLFISVALDSAGIDYHVVLAQNALQQCLDVPELQAELMCALVKQTSRHTQHKIGVQQLLLCATQSLFTCDSSLGGGGSGAANQRGSPTSLQATPPAAPLLDCKTNPPSFVFLQGWQLLALAVSLFVPRNNRLLWYLKLHLHRNADSKSECGKYAAYCQRALERTLQNGGREAKPSRMEVLSILLKNPYHHSLPHAIPVHMLNSTYQVVSFDGSATIEEFLSTLNQEIGCRDVTHSGFTLFSDDPIEKDLEHFIDLQAKLCDVISKWETALREKGSGKFENTRVIQLTYKNRLYWRHSAKMETDRERLLLCYQVNQQVINGRFPLNRELALELSALMAQIDYGEYNPDKGRGSGGVGGNPHHHVLQALDKFYPYRYKDGLTPDELRDLQERLTEKWSSLKGRSLLDCVRIYLTCTRKWPFFGTALFQARMRSGGGDPGGIVWLAVTEETLTVLELDSMQPVAKYLYTSIVTFGGCQDDFMLVVSLEEGGGSQKLLFSLSKPKVSQFT
uniref:Pleckstrin homology domain-containing family H member 1 n=1 Tax=Timema tahoe TaxID=61484 RepID=A0A7R9NUA3_9NEOP|nr:unnamed protein product [Timema tahoe]